MKFFAVAGVIFFTALTVPAGEVAIDGKVSIDEDKLREIIKQVIKENPKLIYDTINDYAKEQKKQKQVQQLESSFKNRIKDIAVNAGNPSRGPKDAAITIIEFTDFQCPYCARAANTVEDVLQKYSGKVKLVLKNNPLDFHKQAKEAAAAALAANKQGKFWEYHDLLFKNSSNLSEEMFVKFAQELSLDMEKFDNDRNSDEIAAQVESEKKEAEKHNLKGTPSFVANGVVIRGAQSLDYFSKVIDRLLAEKK
jgi:protein-disulfide isomerase